MVSQQHVQRSKKTFLSKINTARSELIYLVKGEDKGKPAWYYIQVDKKKDILFQRAISNSSGGNIDLKCYGEVIKYGWGKEPPESAKKYIEEQYGQ